MPTARESLLNAALAALDELPWSGVRMVDVAAAAGVSRQTLYNEFGGKDGLARALVRREADAYLLGVDRLLSDPHGNGPADGRRARPASLPTARTRAPGVPARPARPGLPEPPAVSPVTPPGPAGSDERLVAVAEWTVGQARSRPLLRALLTGCWGDRLPAPKPAGLDVPRTGAPAQRRADAGSFEPCDVVAAVRDRSLAALGRGRRHDRTDEDPAELAHRCELAVRLALSYVVAPGGGERETGEGIGPLVRTAMGVPDGTADPP
ncbi:TetR family transcriptional regulator [Streptomyces sp. NPDC004838]